jgi:hypothetical protein
VSIRREAAKAAVRNVFTMRLRLPDGYVIAPHTHPNVERVTVVSDTFLLGVNAADDPRLRN